MTADGPSYAGIIEQLRLAYERSAAERDVGEKSAWKLAERHAFVERLRAEGKTRLLEVGAGTGQDSLFFQEHGLDVVATDLTPGMVERCRAKGLKAHAMDFLNLDFPAGSFDAGYAFNCLLHVPDTDFPAALASIRRVLAPQALFYVGLYGGDDVEGVLPDDWHHPPRFFSFRSDARLLALTAPHFDLVDFHIVAEGDVQFQAMTLRVSEV